MFGIDLESQDDLNGGKIPEDLRRGLGEAGTLLSCNAEVTIEEDDSRWLGYV